MRELVESITRRIVDHPDQVKLTEVTGEQTVILELRCNAKDVGKVIGKNGRVVAALRTLLTALAQKQGKRAVLEVVE